MGSELTNNTVCNLCGKAFDLWDTQEDFSIERHIGYGSVYDGEELHMRLCCNCMDKLISGCTVSPIPNTAERADIEHKNNVNRFSVTDDSGELIVEYTYRQEVANAE